MTDLFMLAIKKTIEAGRDQSEKWFGLLHSQLGSLAKESAKKKAIRDQLTLGTDNLSLAQYLNVVKNGKVNN